MTVATASLLTLGRVPFIPGVPGDNGSGHNAAPLLPPAPPGVHGGAGGLSAGPGGLPAIPGVPGGGANPAPGVATDIIAPLVSTLGQAATWLWTQASGLLLHLPGIDTGRTGAIANVGTHLSWLTAAIAMIALLVAAAKLALNPEDGRNTRNIARGVLILACVGMAVPVAAAANEALNAIGLELLHSAASDHDVQQRVGSLVAGLGALPVGVGLFAGPILILSSFALLCLAVMRSIALVLLLAVFLPITAATATLDGGWHAFRRCCGWLGAWLVLPLMVAVLTSTAMYMVGDGHNLLDVASGLAFATATVLVLPVLLRIAHSITGTHPAGGHAPSTLALMGLAAQAARTAVSAGVGGGAGATAATGRPTPTGARSPSSNGSRPKPKVATANAD